MNLVTLEDVSKQFSERVLLDSVNLLINEGARIEPIDCFPNRDQFPLCHHH